MLPCPARGLYGNSVQQQGKDESQVCKYWQHLVVSVVQEGTFTSNNGSLKATEVKGARARPPSAQQVVDTSMPEPSVFAPQVQTGPHL